MPRYHRSATEQPDPKPKGAARREAEVVRISLLGGFSVSVGARTIKENEWRLKKAASLVKLLALEPGHQMHREQLMEWLWPDLDPKAASNNLRQTLHVARRVLSALEGSRYLASEDEALVLCPEGRLWVDVEAFTEAAATARRAREPGAYRAALDLYAGDLLPGDRYEEWAEERREGLRQLYQALLVELAGLYEEREEYVPAIEALRRVVVEEPTQEEAHASLIRLYALRGQHREAVLQYEQLRQALSEELGTQEPSDASRRLYEEIRAGEFPVAPSPSAAPSSEDLADSSPNNLPTSRTSFVGREREMLEIKRELAMTRLLTLTGTGGSGKTRLALEVAKDLVGTYPDGVWLVELAGLSEGVLVPQAVAAVLGVQEQPDRSLTDTLVDALRKKKMLLLLDNCEHLIDAAARLTDTLLDSCPRLRVLATSREALSVSSEVNWPVSSLSLPDPQERPTAEELEGYEAARLFAERALFVERTLYRSPGFALAAENAQTVAQICWRLEGIPLAIELAAAWVGTLSVEQISERLENSLRLLKGGSRTAVPRQQTLRGAMDWSYELLSEPEQMLFRRLSVFAGGWTLEATEAIGAGDGVEEEDVLDLLWRLVNKSLVVAEASPKAGGALRYRMLEPVRQYAREKLEESGETEQIQERHARYYLALGEATEPELMGTKPMAALEQLEVERGNLRAVLSWALDADEEPEERTEIGLRLATALGRFWDAQGPGEGRRWLEKGLAHSDASPTSVRAKALNEAGFIAVYEGDPGAMALLEEGLALYKELGDRSGVALSISNLGHAVVHHGDRERVVSLREEVEALLSEPLDRRVTAHLLLFLGFAAASEGDFEQMIVRQEEALALFRELGDIRNVATCLPSIGMAVLAQGGSERAAALFEEGLLLQRELKYKSAIFFGLMGMAGVAALREQPARAARLFGAAEALREEIGLSLTSSANARYDYEGYLGTARAGLSEAAFDAAWSEGRAMSPEQAIEYVLSTEEPSPHAASEHWRTHTDKSQDTLSHREREVADLVARGLTNRQVASELSISEHTVANHLAKILRKLGFHSRSQLTAWVVEQRSLP